MTPPYQFGIPEEDDEPAEVIPGPTPREIVMNRVGWAISLACVAGLVAWMVARILGTAR